MAIPFLKASIGLGVTAVTVGGSVLVVKGMGGSSKASVGTILDKLKKRGYIPLDVAQSYGWSVVLDAYNKKKDTPSLRFDHGDKQVSEQKIKDACEDVFKEDEKDSRYEKARKWCVVPNSVSQVLESRSLKVLDTTKTGEEDKDKWEALKAKYKGNDIPNFSFQADQDWKELRKKCKELVDKKPWDDDYEDSIVHAEGWCTDKTDVG